MAECGICLDVLRTPVCVPCGHIHCEKCLRSYIGAGADALKSSCPTCRKPFHIATPDFAFVPQKYHEFILPTVRKVYMDIPSVAVMSKEMDALAKRLDVFAKENEQLRQRCTHYKDKLGELQLEKLAISEQEAEARQETSDLRKKYKSLKKRYREDVQSYDNEYDQSLSRCSSQNFDTSCEIRPKEEEYPVSLQDLDPNPSRPKRALPRSRLSSAVRDRDGSASQTIKRQRTHRHSDVGSSDQRLTVGFKGEDEEDE